MESKTTRVGLLLLFFASLILVIAVPGDALHNNDSDSASELVPLYLGEVDTVDYYFDHDNFGTSIGIDLVYSHSCVGVARNGRIEIIPNDLGNTKTPNWISFTDNQTLIGEAAKNQATFYPQATIFDVKPLLTRKFGDPEVQRKNKNSPNKVVNNEGKPYIEVKVRGETKTFSPEEITAMFLGKIKDMAENYIRKRVRIAILIVPDYFNYEQMSAVKKAAVLAGFNQAQVINHAVAAFYAHNLHNRKGESNFLLFHLSGDRCDVTIVDHDNGVFEILARRGDIQLGGQEFNQRVVNHFISLIKSKYGRDISKDTSALEKLLNECERATIALSSQEQVMVEVESLFDGFNFSEPLTRTRFEELNQGLFEKMMALAEKALEEAGLKKVDIHDILLVGGSAKIPKVQKLLKDFFDGKEPNKAADHVNPNEVLVRGALVFGGSWNEYGFYLWQVLPVSVGIETVGGVMTKVIRRNNIVPVKNVKKIFTTNQDNQSTIEIKVYNGERRVVKDCRELGRFNLTGILPAPRGTPQVEITFDIDDNYILHAKAEDKASKTSASKTFFGVTYGYDSGEELIRMSEIVEEEDRMYWLEKSQNLLKNTQEPNNNNAAIE